MADDDVQRSLNFTFLYAKYYIYCSKQFGKNNIDLWQFHIKLTYKLKQEIKILKKTNNHKNATLLAHYENILNILQP